MQKEMWSTPLIRNMFGSRIMCGSKVMSNCYGSKVRFLSHTSAVNLLESLSLQWITQKFSHIWVTHYNNTTQLYERLLYSSARSCNYETLRQCCNRLPRWSRCIWTFLMDVFIWIVIAMRLHSHINYIFVTHSNHLLEFVSLTRNYMLPSTQDSCDKSGTSLFNHFQNRKVNLPIVCVFYVYFMWLSLSSKWRKCRQMTFMITCSTQVLFFKIMLVQVLQHAMKLQRIFFLWNSRAHYLQFISAHHLKLAFDSLSGRP